MASFFDGPLPTRTIEATVGDQPVTIEIPIHGALLAGEARHAAQHLYQNTFSAHAGALADALLADGFEPDQAERTATRILSVRMQIPIKLEDSEHRALIRHASLVTAAESTLSGEFASQQIRKATAVIRFRVKEQRHWTDEDTEARIPQPVVNALAAFFDQEQAGGKPESTPEEIVEGMIETLGKLAPSVAQAVDVTATESTGTTSSGEPEPSGQQTPALPPSASPTPPSRTSTRRSSKGNAGD
jgi:hypothetical protein